MTRFARRGPVVVFEEPVWTDEGAPRLVSRTDERSGVVVATPHLSWHLPAADKRAALRSMLDRLLAERGARSPVLWFYTPMMFDFASHVGHATVVYDCMDELSGFKFADPELPRLEAALIARADAVFTGGHAIYEAKRHLHGNIHPFPSSVDAAHFAAARAGGEEPALQRAIPHPRLGFYGVIDERMDLGLVDALAAARPDWHVVMVGPLAKLDPAALPRRANIHWIGPASYDELPRYLGGWGAALMPFAINEATRFISPTKTPEYLAGGRVVVSTAVADVVRHYSGLESVRIADTAEGFVAACEAALALAAEPERYAAEVEALLASKSWDATFDAMARIVDAAAARRRVAPPAGIALPALDRGARAADVLVVGAGFAGSVMAERLAAEGNKRVLVIDRRPHVAGNAYDHLDAAGVLIHRYGPHIFHTNSAAVFDYLSHFTAWRPYEHRVLARVRGREVPMPINRTTLNALYGLDLKSDAEAAAYLASVAEPVSPVRTSEDVVVAGVGRDLYETFFRGYTRKQWGMDPSDLDKSVAARVPARTDTDDRYFTDAFQAMPRDGYTRMFERMLDHERIEVETGVEYRDVMADGVFDHVVFTGAVDEFFDHRFGRLPYRSLEFRHVTLDQERFQAVGTVNYPDEAVPYTRITEYKHLTGQKHPKTSLTYEHPRAAGDPYYPIPRPENQALFKRYEALARERHDVSFVGRLATYRYYNMDQVVGQALSTSKALLARWAASPRDGLGRGALADA
ncbi:UDP-galactopyranose mutase [Lichenibacterium dinghuense]|uniref:UDP-galactopyranose mutase n=1 Tax=Lichenibacterium dinghuense TaxID=2895977 RepID=UPI001F009D24|nr:UDP-galactopyranose mutase [Lichenibacterium sp. 6Y81]